MNDRRIVKHVYSELSRLHGLGFTAWRSRALKLVRQYNIDLFHNDANFETYCPSSIENKFRQSQELEVQNIEKIPYITPMQELKHLSAQKIYWIGKTFQVQKCYYQNSHQLPFIRNCKR